MKMKKTYPSRLMVALLLMLMTLSAQGQKQTTQKQTALDEYVQKPDGQYGYKVVDSASSNGVCVLLVRMTSQQWRTDAEVSPSIWKHWMRIYIPEHVTHSTGMLYILGGATKEEHPEIDNTLVMIAAKTQSVVTALFNIPNEPTTFIGDPHGARTEDEIIAYTWRKMIETGDTTWPLRLPMTKAAVRAMDTVTAITASDEGGHHAVDHFVVIGASKRGWTTWTTAAADTRVVAIAPMVIDVLNVEASFEHHYRSYGFWSTAVKSYYDEGLMDKIETRGFKKLLEIEDPFAYKDRLTMPKLLLNAAGDQFFLPDSSQFYFSQLPGENHLLYEPNTDHSLRGSDAVESIVAFYQSALNGTKRPEIHWSFEPNGSIRVTTSEKPSKVTLWQASNATARDFRLETIGKAYKPTELTAEQLGVYVAHVAKPAQGWIAYFVKVEFEGGEYPLRFSTAVRVLPDVEPYTLPHNKGTLLENSPQKTKMK